MFFFTGFSSGKSLGNLIGGKCFLYDGLLLDGFVKKFFKEKVFSV